MTELIEGTLVKLTVTGQTGKVIRQFKEKRLGVEIDMVQVVVNKPEITVVVVGIETVKVI